VMCLIQSPNSKLRNKGHMLVNWCLKRFFACVVALLEPRWLGPFDWQSLFIAQYVYWPAALHLEWCIWCSIFYAKVINATWKSTVANAWHWAPVCCTGETSAR
jgi:hypothetical protein